jgi:hypothetical protein
MLLQYRLTDLRRGVGVYLYHSMTRYQLEGEENDYSARSTLIPSEDL